MTALAVTLVVIAAIAAQASAQLVYPGYGYCCVTQVVGNVEKTSVAYQNRDCATGTTTSDYNQTFSPQIYYDEYYTPGCSGSFHSSSGQNCNSAALYATAVACKANTAINAAGNGQKYTWFAG